MNQKYSGPQSFRFAATLVLLAAGHLLAADNEPAPDKSSYTLFHPVPADQLRDLNSDRPDLTEGPFTVDAGHYQLESDFFTFTHARDITDGADARMDAWSFATINLRTGLSNHSELDLMLAPYNLVRTADRTGHTVTHQSGFGDTVVRYKYNFCGDDGGRTAFGVMPLIKFPSNQDGLGNHAIEGGIIFPLNVNLPAGWSLGAMTEFDFNQNSGGGAYHTEFVNSIVADHDIVAHLGGYVEFYSSVSTERGTEWQGYFDFGLEYQIGKNVQLDAGLNYGLTRATPAWNPFAGITVRF
jgi:hypothetical protein